MSRQVRATALVALVFGGLLAFALLVIFARQSVPATNATAPPITPQRGYLFAAVQPETITRIVLHDPAHQRDITYTRVPGDWTAVDGAGKAITADLSNIARMIQILATLSYNRVLEESSVATYGLAGDGKVSIDFDDAGKSYHLRIGEATPYGDTTYVQRDADPSIYLAPTAALSALTSVLATPPPTP